MIIQRLRLDLNKMFCTVQGDLQSLALHAMIYLGVFLDRPRSSLSLVVKEKER